MASKDTPGRGFRELLQAPGIIMAPGAYDCLTATIIEKAGFPAVYMTGAGTSVARLGKPDLALAGMTEMVANAAYIVDAVNVLVVADADTGYGGVLNVARTVRLYERAGVAAIHIEDQESPKRCGHLDDKRVVDPAEMVQKIQAAVDARSDEDFTIIVRTDALAVTGWEDTVERCHRYVEAGADMLFVEAIGSPEQGRQLTASFGVPLMYNFVESGKSPLLPAGELEGLGFKMVIFPVSALLVVCQAVSALMAELKSKGTTESLLGDMFTLEACFNLVGLRELMAQDARFAGALGG